MADRVVIGYLTQFGRHYNFEYFCETMKMVKNKEFITTLVLTHEIQLVDFFEAVIKKTRVHNVLVALVSDAPHNYMNKINCFVNYALENNIKYTIKIDNDIYFNPGVLDYMYENRHMVEDPHSTKNMCISPNLSSGIPSCDIFNKDFFTKDEQAEMTELFRTHEFGFWCINDYSFLKDAVHDGWDINKYYTALNLSDIYYKGVHPVRMNNAIMKRQNEIVLNHLEELFKEQKYYTYSFEFDPYQCNSFFMISSKIYRELIDDKSLFVDSYDEVPINKFCVKNKWKKIYIGNSFTLHPWYNSYPEYLREEHNFFNEVMKVKASVREM